MSGPDFRLRRLPLHLRVAVQPRRGVIVSKERHVRYRRRPQRDYEDHEESIGEDLAAINERLDDLTRQIERAVPGRRARDNDSDNEQQSSDRVAEALARLD